MFTFVLYPIKSLQKVHKCLQGSVVFHVEEGKNNDNVCIMELYFTLWACETCIINKLQRVWCCKWESEASEW